MFYSTTKVKEPKTKHNVQCSEHGKSQHALVLKSKSTTPLKLYKGC